LKTTTLLAILFTTGSLLFLSILSSHQSIWPPSDQISELKLPSQVGLVDIFEDFPQHSVMPNTLEPKTRLEDVLLGRHVMHRTVDSRMQELLELEIPPANSEHSYADSLQKGKKDATAYFVISLFMNILTSVSTKVIFYFRRNQNAEEILSSFRRNQDVSIFRNFDFDFEVEIRILILV
jgi:preprotein translocase subunit SecG